MQQILCTVSYTSLLKILSVIFIVTVILTKEVVLATEQCSECQFKSPFYPGESCEEIYSKNPESHDRPGYYWILTGPSKVYCGMNYTGSSCEGIYYNNPETADNSGYYRINEEWMFCNMVEIAANYILTCAGVGGGWRRITNIDISTGDDCPSGWRRDNYNDGLSITHGNPRQHIWTFSNGQYGSIASNHNCPCGPGSTQQSSPSFVSTN